MQFYTACKIDFEIKPFAPPSLAKFFLEPIRQILLSSQAQRCASLQRLAVYEMGKESAA
jgi:hypothetical protein